MATKKSKLSKDAKTTRRAEVVAQYQRQQARAKRRSRLIIAFSVVAAVVIIGGTIVTIGLNRDGGSSAATTAAEQAVISGVTSVPAATYDAIGAGPVKVAPKKIDAPPLMADGLPKVLYIGSEYCPFCAAERWSVTAAMSRFGTFSNLGQTTSSHDDVYPDTATLSFHGSSYQSDYLAFTGIEEDTNQRQGAGYKPLDKVPAEDQKILDTYNYPPYVTGQGGSIPFIDLGGQYIASGASFDPGVLKDMTHEEIAKAMSDPGSAVAQAIDGSANIFTAALCDLTKGKPATVCESSGVTAAAGKIGS